ncbi:MAG: pseudouridine synthase [Phycisphaeraceae bacterium]
MIPPEFTDKSRGIRLQKAIANAGIASRRDSEQLIEQGRVHVNGQAVTELPAFVDPVTDRIAVDGRELPRPRKTSRPETAHTYIILHKPRGVISTTDDPQGRATVTDLVKAPGAARLYPVGRLDADSAGLILLTDDGELANRLTHPRYGVAKRYEVSVRGHVTQEQVQRLRDGLILVDRKGAPAAKRAAAERVVILGYERDRTRGDRTALAITLREGQNREIRRLLARLGYKVRRLKRVAIGPISLKGLATGEHRRLTGSERNALRRAAGL